MGRLKFGLGVEAQLVKFFLRHLQAKGRIRKKYEAAVFVFCQVARLEFLKLLELRRVLLLNPHGFVGLEWLVGTLGSVFMFEAVLDYLILEGAHSSNDLSAIANQREELGDAFIHKLVDTFR